MQPNSHSDCFTNCRKQFVVKRLIELWNMLPNEVIWLVRLAVWRDTSNGFWCDLDSITITSPTCIAGSHRAI